MMFNWLFCLALIVALMVLWMTVKMFLEYRYHCGRLKAGASPVGLSHRLGYKILPLLLLTFLHAFYQLGFFAEGVVDQASSWLGYPYTLPLHYYHCFLPVAVSLLVLEMRPFQWKQGNFFIPALLTCAALLMVQLYPGKDLLLVTGVFSLFILWLGLTPGYYPLHYRYFLAFGLLHHSWLCLFYFSHQWSYALGLMLQIAATYYLFKFIKLFWSQFILGQRLQQFSGQ